MGGGGGGGRAEQVCVCVGGGVLKPVLRVHNRHLGSTVVHKHTSYSVRMKDSNSSMHQNSKHINEDSLLR